MAWSLLDISAITDDLVAMLEGCIAASPMWVDNGGPITRFNLAVSGSMPESVRKEGGCQLTLYLLHVETDKANRNTPVLGPTPQGNRRHPLSLDLYYLMTAFAEKDYHQEQQAMSIAMRCFHEKSIVTSPTQQFTLTLETKSADEMAQIWQAMTTPLRLSVVYRVAVVFITPSQTAPAPAAPPTKVRIAVTPADVRALAAGGVYGPSLVATFKVPPGATPADVEVIRTTFSPAALVPGDTVLVAGAGLDSPKLAKVYLTPAGGAEVEVSAWRKPPVTASELRLGLPSAVGALPANAPPSGLYLLSVGSDVPAVVRSNAVPVMVAARVDNVLDPPELVPDGSGLYTVEGVGFIPAQTVVILDTVPLTPVASPPGAGEFQVNGAGTLLTFKRPATLAPGRYWVRVRVNQVDAAPSWFIVV